MAEKNTVKNRKPKLVKQGKMDIPFFSLVIILLAVGLVMLFSSSYAYSYKYFNNSYHFIIRQAIFAAVGVVVMLVLSRIDYHFYRKFAIPLYIVMILVLGIMLVLPPMISGLEYKRWLVIGPISFQPSEIAKFSIILLFSHLICKYRNQMKTLKMTLILTGLLGVFCVLVVFEPHLSATILIFIIGAVLMVIGGLAVKYMVATGVIGLISVLVIVISGAVSYATSRFQYWLNPWADARGDGYQTIQSLLAIGSGGVLGRGLGQSRQKYLWVPEPHNDFIFSIVCEELGLIGAIVIILLFAALVYRGFKIALNAEDSFGSFMAIGLTFQVGLQAALNILVVTNTVPNTGISLPFFSYGGTALLILLAEMGIVLSISRGATLEKA